LAQPEEWHLVRHGVGGYAVSALDGDLPGSLCSTAMYIAAH
jgi:hypothetical protein